MLQRPPTNAPRVTHGPWPTVHKPHFRASPALQSPWWQVLLTMRASRSSLVAAERRARAFPSSAAARFGAAPGPGSRWHTGRGSHGCGSVPGRAGTVDMDPAGRAPVAPPPVPWRWVPRSGSGCAGTAGEGRRPRAHGCRISAHTAAISGAPRVTGMTPLIQVARETRLPHGWRNPAGIGHRLPRGHVPASGTNSTYVAPQPPAAPWPGSSLGTTATPFFLFFLNNNCSHPSFLVVTHTDTHYMYTIWARGPTAHQGSQHRSGWCTHSAAVKGEVVLLSFKLAMFVFILFFIF